MDNQLRDIIIQMIRGLDRRQLEALIEYLVQLQGQTENNTDE